jgi:hypothetical protein
MAKTLKEERSWSDNWHGKAKQLRRMRIDATYDLARLLRRLNVSAKSIAFWDDDIEEYVNRVMWAGKDKYKKW